MPRIRIQRQQAVQDLSFGNAEPAGPSLTSQRPGWTGLPFELHQAQTTGRLGEVGPVDGEHGMLVILNGELRIERRLFGKDRSYGCAPGAINYLSGRHRQNILGMAGQASVLAVHLPDEWFHRMELDAPPAEFGLTTASSGDPHAAALLAAMVAEVQVGGVHGSLYAESLSTAFLARAMASVPAGAMTPVRSRLSMRQCAALREYVRENLGRELSLTELSAVVRLSPRRFGTLFRWAFGLTPHQFLLVERMDLACQLLREQRMTAAELAEKLGFSSGNHFTSTFRKFMGTTPQRYASSCRITVGGRGFKAE